MKKGAVYVLSLLILLGVLVVCVSVGSTWVPPGETLRVLLGYEIPESAARSIILSVRLPRVLCALSIGGALSLSGAAMQALLRNPLADGSTLGVSSGAALGAVIAIWSGVLPVTGAAIAFGFGAFLLILALSYGIDRGLSTTSVILLGVILSMLFSSLLSLIISFAGEKLRTITFWTMGTLSSAGYGQAALVSGVLAGGLILLFPLAEPLNIFSLGEEQARQLGVHVGRVKLCAMAAASALVGVCVAVSGTIGFVGLTVPHMLRLALGSDNRRLFPMSVLWGGIFLMLSDLAARTLVAPVELPIGVVTSLIGAVVFIPILVRSKRGNGL